MGWTSPRQVARTTVAVAHQTAWGSAASAAGTVARAQCVEAEVSRGVARIDPQSTSGSEYPRDVVADSATRPSARIKFYAGSRPFLAAILEYALRGQPTATLANSDLTETGDDAGVLSAWVLTGVRPGFNTDTSFQLYVKLEDEVPGAGQARVSLYSDSARTALVAQGSAANGASCTLAEQNSSGLSGTVTLGTVSADNLTGCYLSILQVRPQRAGQIARYFTLWRDSGSELEQISDCAVRRARFSSEAAGPLVVEVDAVGSTYSIAASALSPSSPAAEREYYSHLAAAVSYNGAEESALSCSHGIEHDVVQSVGCAASPTAIWSRGSRILPVEFAMRMSDESRSIRDDAVAGTWRAASASYAAGGKLLAFSWPRCLAASTDMPATRDRQWADHRIALEARDDGTNDPVSITIEL